MTNRSVQRHGYWELTGGTFLVSLETSQTGRLSIPVSRALCQLGPSSTSCLAIRTWLKSAAKSSGLINRAHLRLSPQGGSSLTPPSDGVPQGILTRACTCHPPFAGAQVMPKALATVPEQENYETSTEHFGKSMQFHRLGKIAPLSRT